MKTYTTKSYSRWDYLSFLFYRSFDYVQQLIEANKQLNYEYRKAVFLPPQTLIYVPTLEEVKASAQVNTIQPNNLENFPSFVGAE